MPDTDTDTGTVSDTIDVPAAGARGTTDVADVLAEETLVDEVSIDGMCGVY